MTDVTRERARDQPRTWPGMAIVLLQWIAVAATGWIAPATAIQFFGMVGGPLVGLGLLLVWWLAFSRVSAAERVVAALLMLGCVVVSFPLMHRSAKLAFYTFGIPGACAAFVLAAWIARLRSRRSRLLLTAIAVAAVCLGWLLVRGEGVDGDMNFRYAWRWSATDEERLLRGGDTMVSEIARADPLEPPATVAWPGFRGARRDGVVRGIELATDWSATPPRELWRRLVGPGWSSFAVAGDRLYTQEQRGAEELVRCYRASTGDVLWTHTDEARFWESLAGAGPRATPTYHAGHIYAFGATGILNCLDAETGTLLWRRDSAADTAAVTPDWGFAGSPLVVDGLVVVHTGGTDGKAVVAYDADHGEPRWYARAGTMSYSSAQLEIIDGVRQLVMLTGEGASALAPEDGAELWNYAWPMPGGARIVQPALIGDGSLLIGTGFGMGVRRIALERRGEEWSVREDWTSTGLKPYYNDFVVHRDHVYGFDGRILAGLELASGERVWKGGRYGNGQLLLLPDQDLLLVLSDRGEVALVAAVPDGFSELTRFRAIEGRTWNHPVIADGVLFVRNGREMAAFRLPRR